MTGSIENTHTAHTQGRGRREREREREREAQRKNTDTGRQRGTQENTGKASGTRGFKHTGEQMEFDFV